MQSPDPGISLGALFSARTPATPAVSPAKRADAPKFEDSLTRATDRPEPVQRSERPSRASDRPQNESVSRNSDRDPSPKPAAPTNETRNETGSVERQAGDRVSSYARARLLIAKPTEEPLASEAGNPVVAPSRVEVISNLKPVAAEPLLPDPSDAAESEVPLLHIQPWPLESTPEVTSHIDVAIIPDQEVVVEGSELPVDTTQSGGFAPELAYEPQSIEGSDGETPPLALSESRGITGTTRPVIQQAVASLQSSSGTEAERNTDDTAPTVVEVESETAVAVPADAAQGANGLELSGQAPPIQPTTASAQVDPVQRSERPVRSGWSSQVSPAPQPEVPKTRPIEQTETAVVPPATADEGPPQPKISKLAPKVESTPVVGGEGADVRPVTRSAVELPVATEIPAADGPTELQPNIPEPGTPAQAVGDENSFASLSNTAAPAAAPPPQPEMPSGASFSGVREVTSATRRAIDGTVVAASAVVSQAEESGDATSPGNGGHDFDAQSFSSLLQAQVTQTSRNRRVGQPIDVNPTQLAEMPGEIVARARRLADNETAELEIQLDPPELGQLKIQLRRTDGEVAARITVTDPAAFELLQHELQDLRQSLEQSDVAFASVDVEQDQQQRQSSDRERQGRLLSEDAEPAARDVPAASPISSNQTIDIRV